MNRLGLLLAALLPVMLCASGCDFFRVVAGRPTSKDIARKKIAMEEDARRHREAEECLRDTLEAILAESPGTAPADTVPSDGLSSDTVSSETPVQSRDPEQMPATVRGSGVKVSGSALITPEARNRINGRYVIIIGAFGSPANAEAQAARASRQSYSSVLIPYSNGLVAVGLCPCDDLHESYSTLLRLRKESFCPADAWILDKTQ